MEDKRLDYILGRLKDNVAVGVLLVRFLESFFILFSVSGWRRKGWWVRLERRERTGCKGDLFLKIVLMIETLSSCSFCFVVCQQKLIKSEFATSIA